MTNVAILFFLFIFCQRLTAQTVDQPKAGSGALEQAGADDFRQRLQEKITASEEDTPLEWDTSALYVPGNTVKAQPGKISILDTESELSYEFKILGGVPIELSLDTQYINIAKNGSLSVDLPAQLTGYGFGLQATVPFFKLKDTYLRARVAPSFFTDNWGATANSFRLPAQLFAIYRPSEKLIFVAGIAASPGTENPLTPIAGLIYAPSDKWVFNLIGERPSITYALNQRLSLFVDGGLSNEEFKVTKAAFKGKALAYKEVHYGGGLQYQAGKNIAVFLSAGRISNRALKYRDSLGKVGIKDSVYTQLRLESGF